MLFNNQMERLIAALEKLIMSTAALEAAITQLTTDVNTLISNSANSVPQSQVDAATAQITALDATVQTAIGSTASSSAPAAAPATPATPAS